MSQHYDIARDLLSIKAVQIETENYFTCTSGIKSPIYCDNRLTMSYTMVIKSIIEGIVKKNQKVLVVEDLISTGGSSIDTVNVLKSMETEVIGVIAIFTYGLQKSVNQFESEKIPWTTLTNFDYIIEALLEDQEIT